MRRKESVNSIKTSNLKVLVVDDDPQIREIIILHLETLGFKKFIQASDGAEGFKYIVDHTQRIDLVICDWEMPRADGLTLLRGIRSSRLRSETSFIMVTSQQSQERMKISKAKKHEVDAYIVKPFRADTLREKVFQVLFEAMEKQKAV